MSSIEAAVNLSNLNLASETDGDENGSDVFEDPPHVRLIERVHSNSLKRSAFIILFVA